MFDTYDRNKTFTAFEGLLEYVQEADRLLRVTVQALNQMRGFGRLSKLVTKSGTQEENAKRIAEAEDIERLAAEEVKNGFPLLYAHSVVALWSALEAVIPRFCADWLMCFPQLLEGKAFAKVSVPASSILLADRRVVVEEIVQALERATQSPLKVGVGRFDLLLDAVGIGVIHDEDRRRTLFELSKVRNVIVHQAGKADKQFVSDCPWVNATVGRRVTIDGARYGSYVSAVMGYAADVAERGRQVAEEEGKIFNR
jgi:hypothetical protein